MVCKKAIRQPVNWKTASSIVVSLAVVVIVIMRLDMDELRRTLENASLPWLFVAFAVYLLSYILRTLRFRQLLPSQEIGFAQLYSISSLYGMFLYLMPAKSGEVSLPTMLKLRQGVNVSRSAATLIVARFFDLFSVALFLPLVLVAFQGRIPEIMFWIALAFIVLMVPIGAGYFWWLRRSVDKPPEPVPEDRSDWATGARQWIGHLTSSLRILARMEGQGWLLVNTIAIWLCVYANFYFIAAGLGHWLELGHVVVLSVLMIPLTLFPVQGVANFGSHEAGWVAAFAIFGYPPEQALAVAIGSHAVLLLEVLLLGFVGRCVGQIADFAQRRSQLRVRE
jgi:uncharacterized protein (TIRG00374 family)